MLKKKEKNSEYGFIELSGCLERTSSNSRMKVYNCTKKFFNKINISKQIPREHGWNLKKDVIHRNTIILD